MDEQKLKPHGILEKIDYWAFYHFPILWVIVHRRKIEKLIMEVKNGR